MNYKNLDNLVERKKEKFIDVSDKIWCLAEPAYKEFESSKLQQDLMESEGFTIENNLAGIETAFKASFGSGYPTIGILGEFDALPGLAQKADAEEKIKLESKEDGYGHGCGHNLLGTACMQAAVGIKDYMEEYNLDGRVIYYGCPAEEGGAGKAFMMREKAFNQSDVCISWHPFSVPVGAVPTLANARVYYNFKGVSAHAAVAPHLGRSALDSVELMNIGVNYLREHMIPDAKVHYAVTDTGGNAPNVVQSHAQVLYSVRAPSNDDLYDLLERVNAIAEGAAMMNGTSVEIEIVSAYADVIKNETLDNLVFSHMREIYPLDYTKDEINYAQRYYELGDKSDAIMMQKIARKIYKEKAEGLFQGPLADGIFPPMDLRSGSTDVGDVSWNIPTTWFIGNTWAIGTSPHTWQAVAQGKSSIAHKGMLAAAKVMGRFGIDILKNPKLVDKAKKDLDRELNGREYRSVIPDSVKPGMIK